MKRRGWRVALTVATLGLALVAGLVAFNWATVRDHAEAWWFQLMRETETIEPDASFTRLSDDRNPDLRAALWGPRPTNALKCLLRVLANESGSRVVFDPRTKDLWDEWNFWLPNTVTPSGESIDDIEVARQTLSINGWQVLEQRFPRRAYVVVGYPREGVLREDTTIRFPTFFGFPDESDWQRLDTSKLLPIREP